MSTKTATLIFAENDIRQSGASTALIAHLTGISASTLRDALRGESYLGSERETEIHKVASRLAKIKMALEPLGLPRDVSDVKLLMQLEKSPAEIRRLINKIFEREDVVPFEDE